jgi:hypothetical protein
MARMRSSTLFCLGLAILALCAGVFSAMPSPACPPGFLGPTRTLQDDIADADVVVFCRQSADLRSGDRGGVRFEVTEFIKGESALPQPLVERRGPRRLTAELRSRAAGAEYLVFGKKDPMQEAVRWQEARPVNDREMAFVRCAAGFTDRTTDLERLRLLLPFLSAPEDFVLGDVNSFLKQIDYAAYREARTELPLSFLREELAKPMMDPERLRIYLTMLSVCGTKDDLPLVKSLQKFSPAWRFGARGIVPACSVLLGGEAELAPLLEAYFKHDEEPNWEAPNGYEIFGAVCFAARESTSISRERAIEVLRKFVDRPRFAALAVRELARFDDWDFAPRCMEIFRRTDAQKNSWLKQSAVHFMRASPRADAEQFLAEMRALDLDTVRSSAINYPLVKR